MLWSLCPAGESRSKSVYEMERVEMYSIAFMVASKVVCHSTSAPHFAEVSSYVPDTLKRSLVYSSPAMPRIDGLR